MDTMLTTGTIQKTVMGLSLCLLLLLSVSPASSMVLEESDTPSDVVSPDGTVDLVRLLRSILEDQRLKETLTKELKQFQTEKEPLLTKRGFGIAGLDNVDMITSTLDRSRSRSRYRPKMSLSVDLNQLRALMAKAG